MVRASNARQDAIDAAVRLFRTQGYSATGLTQLLEESGAPKGSFYFHFPGGKEQLALEALQAFGAEVRGRIERRAGELASDPAAFIRAMFDATARELEKSDYTAGCVASNLGGELSSGNRPIAEAVTAVIHSWVEAIADGLQSRFASRDAAVAFASTVMASLSGMRTMARAQRSTTMFGAIADVLVAGLPPAAVAAKNPTDPATK